MIPSCFCILDQVHHACLCTASMLHSIYPYYIHYIVITEIGGVCLFCAFPNLRAKISKTKGLKCVFSCYNLRGSRLHVRRTSLQQ